MFENERKQLKEMSERVRNLRFELEKLRREEMIKEEKNPEQQKKKKRRAKK